MLKSLTLRLTASKICVIMLDEKEIIIIIIIALIMKGKSK